MSQPRSWRTVIRPTDAQGTGMQESAREYGAIFIEQIGKKLASGKPHDGRAPDYDDWELNGDIIVYYPILDIRCLELSSIGDPPWMRTPSGVSWQRLAVRRGQSWHFRRLSLNGELPYTIGGGIGQSRICMFCLKKGPHR